MRTQADHAEYDWHAGPSDDQIAAEMEADRCQQLAALEAEIGRAVVGQSVVEGTILRLDNISTGISCVENQSARTLEQLSNTVCADEIQELIARWRKLHAEGAEGGKG